MKDEEKKILSPTDAATKARDEFRPDSDLPPDADAEERFNDFWKKNGGVIFGAIAIVALVITGIEGYKFFKQRGEEKLQSEFAEVITTDEELNFATEHADKPLGGLAFLEIADEEYAAGNYLQASSHYDAAVAPLTASNSPLSARARLGAALSRLRHGDDTGLDMLDELARDPDAIEYIAAEAAYHHAVASWERGDLAAVRRSLDLLDGFSRARDWQASGDRLASQIPELQASSEASEAFTTP